MFKPKPLKHGFDGYQPYIDRKIMELHWNSHYLGYLKKLNDAISKYPEYFNMGVDEILRNINGIPGDIAQAVRDQGGGVSNHELFWEILNSEPTTLGECKLREDIESAFSSIDNFKQWFEDTTSSSFGSGWVWLVIDKDKSLKIVFTPNQDSPHMSGQIPVFGIDIWEHSYYLQYSNGKIAYLREVWKILNWEKINERYCGLIK